MQANETFGEKMRKIFLIVAALIILGGLGFLFFGKLEETLVYFLTPSELLAKEETAFERPVRLGGMVKKGSIDWDPIAIRLKFLLTDGSKEVAVESRQTPPQMFQEEMGIVVEGKLSQERIFLADRLMVKHSNEYHPPKEGEKPHVIYKDLIKASDAY